MEEHEVYLCEVCTAKRHRSYSVSYFLRACANGCGFRRFVREDILDKIGAIPEAARPDGWSQMTTVEKVLFAYEMGRLSVDDVV
jgi:hypothetical protein